MTPSPEPVYVVLESSQGWWSAWGSTLVPLIVSLVALLGVLVVSGSEGRRQVAHANREAMRSAFVEYLNLAHDDTEALAQMATQEVIMILASGEGDGRAAKAHAAAHSAHMTAWTDRLQVRARIELVASERVQRRCAEFDAALSNFMKIRSQGVFRKAEYEPVYKAQIAFEEAMRADLRVKGSVYVEMVLPGTVPGIPDGQPVTPAPS